MDVQDPYRAPVSPVDMSSIAFNHSGEVSSAATIAGGYSATIVLLRWLASVVDLLALVAIIGIPIAVLGETTARKVWWLWLSLAVAYFPVMETLWGGALGKLATGTRVVTLHGGRPAWWQSIVRTLLRLVEVNPMLLGGIPAGIAVLATGNRQRIGDMLARTYVIKRRDIARIRPPGAARVEPTMPAAR